MPKILIAAGGTGGHLFPAQALAEELLEEKGDLELFFAGAKLSTNAYFDREKFQFYDIASTTPFAGGLLKGLCSVAVLLRGIKESYALLAKKRPDLVVGFGSFHVFPLLAVAALKKIPIVLFESNAMPGKVVRLFSKWARCTGIYFPEARQHLKGQVVEVEIPVRRSYTSCPQEQARAHFHLHPQRTTLLIFGGSQGAKAINRTLLEMLPLLRKQNLPIQLIHLTGCEETAKEMSRLCQQLEIPCFARKFEKSMEMAWSAADAVICRAGAMTLSELLHYEVPGILIPYPLASEQHQLKNALFLEKTVGGAVHILESRLAPETLLNAALPLLGARRGEMQEAMRRFKAQQKRVPLSALVKEGLRHA